MAIYVHLLSVLLVPVLLVWFAVASISRPRARRLLIPMLLLLVLLTLVYLPIVRWQLRLWLRDAFQTGHASVPLGTMLTALLWGFSRGVQGGRSLWTLVPFVFLLLAGLLLPWKENGDPDGGLTAVDETGLSAARRGPMALDRIGSRFVARLWLVTWIALPVLGVFVVSLRKPIFADRYLIWIAPAFYMLMSAGLTMVWRRWRALAIALLLLVLSLNLQATWAHAHTVIKSDFRNAVGYVEKRRAPDELLLFLMPYALHTYNYYAGEAAPFADAPYTNSGATAAQVDADLSRISEGRAAVWLILSEKEMWDRRGLVRSWLQNHGDATDEAQFVRVKAVRYALRTP
jgi:hypothetical protein